MDGEIVETRRHILEAAARLLVQKGRGKVRAVDVAESAFVATPTIYYHFGSLNRLLAEAQELIYQQLSAPLKESLARAELALKEDDEERFWDVIGTHLEAAWMSGRRGRDGTVVMILTGVLSSKETAEKFEEMIDETYVRWLDMIEVAKTKGWANPDLNTATWIAIFWSSSVGQAFLGGKHMSAVDAKEVRETFLSVSRATRTDRE